MELKHALIVLVALVKQVVVSLARYIKYWLHFALQRVKKWHKLAHL